MASGTSPRRISIPKRGTPGPWKKARTAQIDRDGRRTIKRGRKRDAPADRTERRVVPEIAVPMFGYKNHVGIDREYGFVRRYAVTHAAAHDGAQLGQVLDREGKKINTGHNGGRPRKDGQPMKRRTTTRQHHVELEAGCRQQLCNRSLQHQAFSIGCSLLIKFICHCARRPREDQRA